MGVSGLQVGIAALIAVTVDIDGRAGEAAVGGALDVAAVGQRQLHLADGSRHHKGGEPVAIVTAHLIFTLIEVVVVVLQVLVAQTQLSEYQAEAAAKLHKCCRRRLVDLVVGSLDGYTCRSRERVGIGTVVVRVFTAHRKVALPNGITQDELRCPEIVSAAGVALDAAADGDAVQDGCLIGAARRLGAVKQAIHVEVNAQGTHLAVVIGIENVLAETVVLLDVAHRALGKETIHIAISDELVTKVGAGVSVIFVKGAKAVVIVDHIIHLKLGRQAFPDVLTILRDKPLDPVRAYKIRQLVFLQHLGVTVAACPERGGDVQSTRAVVHIQVVGNRVAILVHARQVVLETEAVALRLLECDAHHGLGRGGIAGAWVLDDVDMLNLVTAQARQLAHILHLAAVDIHLGLAASQHRHGAIALGL